MKDYSELVSRLHEWYDAEIARHDMNEAAGAIEALQRDAARYRWLRDNSVGYAMHMGAVLYTPELVVPRGMDSPAIDAAIDAAMRDAP